METKPIWSEKELRNFCQRSQWTLWEEIEYSTCPHWLTKQIEHKVHLSHPFYGYRTWLFYGRHYIYKVEGGDSQSYPSLRIYKQPRGLMYQLENIIQTTDSLEGGK